MQIVAAGIRGPLITDERSETTGFVAGLGSTDVLLPGGAIRLGAGQRGERRRKRALGELVDDFRCDADRVRAALLDHLVPALAGGVGQKAGVARKQLREESEIVGMICGEEEN